MIIEAIKWPLDKELDSDESEEELEPAKVNTAAKFFQTFVEQGTNLYKNLNIYNKGNNYWTYQEKSRKQLQYTSILCILVSYRLVHFHEPPK